MSVTAIGFTWVLLSAVTNIGGGAAIKGGVIGLVLIGFGVGALIILLDWFSTHYILTNKTVEVISGFFTHNRTYVSLHDLSKVEAKVGILGRALGYGTIVIESETAERRLILHGIPSPYQVIDLIREARSEIAGTDR